MSDLPYHQIVWAEFFADTMHMTGNGAKAYLFLIGNAWIRGAKLPDDQGVLARCARCTPREWASIKDEVMALWFKDENGFWTQKRIRADFAKTLSRVDANRENGKLGGRPKSAKKLNKINKIENPTVTNGFDILESESESESKESSSSRVEPPRREEEEEIRVSKVRAALGDKTAEHVVIGVKPILAKLEAEGCNFEADILPKLREVGQKGGLQREKAPWLPEQIRARRDARLAAPARTGPAPATRPADVWVQRGTPAWEAWEAHEGKALIAVETRWHVGEWGRYFPSPLPKEDAPPPLPRAASPDATPQPRRFIDMRAMLARADVTQLGSPS